ncbi:MAG: metal-sensitive transcriptional regulator [Micrococcus sp.]|nr:metal-sensitive transcriptional regulator [Micrococcus sp.]
MSTTCCSTASTPDPDLATAAADPGTGPAEAPIGAPHGYDAQRKAYLTQLKRIEGQVRGIARMIEQDVYCIDVLTQVSAATKSLQSVSLKLMDDHLRHCVAEAAVQANAEGRQDIVDAKVAEATAAIGRLLR